MILDRLLLLQLPRLGNILIKQIDINGDYPNNIGDLKKFLERLKFGIENGEFESSIIGKILYEFISAESIRDRNTTSRNFEDIFSAIFDTTSRDIIKRSNPSTPEEILNYDKLTKDMNWSISRDLASNKREKVDVIIGDYELSVKTLKGINYGLNNEVKDKKLNQEINVGSFSYRALFKGIISDEIIEKLGDRKSGLGSSSQIKKNVVDYLIKNNLKDIFLERLRIFFGFVYEEDLIIVLKSNYKITFHLISNESYCNTIYDLFNYHTEEFHTIWTRWENNNLRFNWLKLLDKMIQLNYNYDTVDIQLDLAINNIAVNRFIDIIEETIVTEMNLFT